MDIDQDVIAQVSDNCLTQVIVKFSPPVAEQAHIISVSVNSDNREVSKPYDYG